MKITIGIMIYEAICMVVEICYGDYVSAGLSAVAVGAMIAIEIIERKEEMR